MKFIKMHGIGNDYIFVNCFEEHVEEPEKLAVKLSNRHYGIGGDGLILIKPARNSFKTSARADMSACCIADNTYATAADAKMEIYNADGSRAQMCGNGIRCVAWYIFYYKKLERDTVYIEADDGTVKIIHLEKSGYDIKSITVNMGKPRFVPAEIPAIFAGKEKIVNEMIRVNNSDYNITCVNMGNPHCVIFTDTFTRQSCVLKNNKVPVTVISDSELSIAGSAIENAKEYFPEKINVEFVHCVTRSYIRMRVWERGSGITLACGTGACAAVIAGIVNGFLDREVTVELDGGILSVCWDEITGDVFMTGDVKKVFVGEI